MGQFFDWSDNMDAAPKDGTRILVSDRKDGIMTAEFVDFPAHGRGFAAVDGGWILNPTHWARLPDGPK